MGIENDKKKQDNKKFITFEIIQESLGIKSHSLFKKYLQEIFVDLSCKSEKSKSKILSRLTFYDYIKLPFFISEKLYNSFASSSQQEGLTEEQFVNGFYNLYMGTFEETSKIIFNLLDFDKDGIITKEDVKIILSYLPLNDVSEKKGENLDTVKESLGFQMKSLEEIEGIVNQTFTKYENMMNFEQFMDVVQNKKSDVFLQLISLLYLQKPFTGKNIENIKLKYGEINNEEFDKIFDQYHNLSNKKQSVKIRTPNQSSSFSPIGMLFKRKFSIKGFKLKEKTKGKENTKKDELPIKQGYSDSKVNKNIKNMEQKSDLFNKNMSMVRLNNERTLKDDSSPKFQKENLTKNDYKELMDHSKARYSSPTKYLQEKAGINTLILMKKTPNLEQHLSPINEEENNLEGEKNICYENWIYKLSEANRLKKFYLSLVNKEIYYYKDQEKKHFSGMHNLSGCFVSQSDENEIVLLDKQPYYSFEIFFNNKSKSRTYYVRDLDVCKKFVESIKEAIGYMKFTDYYELKEVIGKGKFGTVNLGIHKKTQQQVAVKIINKDNLKNDEDKELVLIEIGILKLCHHPNIVRLLDHLENENYIFIVMEYIEGGTLNQYIKKKNYNFNENQAASIMLQIANGVKYLHRYGIVHRDLKPDNIMITEQNDLGIIKIMDFGLSKIVSTQETMREGYGTLSYVAPEVLLRIPYNKEVDIWSMGIILYLMLCGHVPFKGNKEKIIAEKIVNEDVEFKDEEWEIRTKRAKDLIISCLKKEPKDRITIENFINHPWFKKNVKPKKSM